MIEWAIAVQYLGRIAEPLAKHLPKLGAYLERRLRPLRIEPHAFLEDLGAPGSQLVDLTFRNIAETSITVHTIKAISPSGLRMQKPPVTKRDTYWDQTPRPTLEQMALGIRPARVKPTYSTFTSPGAQQLKLDLAIEPLSRLLKDPRAKPVTWRCYLLLPPGADCEHITLEVCSTLNLELSREISTIIQIKNMTTPISQKN